MNTVPTVLNRHQSATAWAMNSGPLSQRTNPGTPRSSMSRSRTAYNPVGVDPTVNEDRWAFP